MDEVVMPVRPAFPVPEPVPVQGLGWQNTFRQNQPNIFRQHNVVHIDWLVRSS